MDIESLLFSRPDASRTDISKGDVLVAEPLMQEGIFRRSVILILDADVSSGYMGLVLNHKTSLSMQDLIPKWEGGKRVPLFAGGPVDLERLFMLHTLGDVFKGCKEILPGIFVGANMDDVVEYVDSGGEVEGRMRFFLGYSGWQSNQLESELLGKSWALERHEPASALLQGTGNAYWRRQVARLGDSYRSWLIVPQDAAHN
jgi:putative transcriptional regulator